MPTFHYHALNAEGQPVSGSVDAGDVQQAAADLQVQGLRIQSISIAAAADLPAEDASPANTRRPGGATETGVERAVLHSHMKTILERGRGIAPALRAYAEELPRGWQRNQLNAACDVLLRGDTAGVASTLADLPEFWIPLLGAANASSDPGVVLSEFLGESQNTNDLRQRWWLTVAYPLILACLALTVMTALSVFIIPQFHEIFNDFGMSLPSLSLLVLSIGGFLSAWGLVFIVVCIILLVLMLLNANRLLPATRLQWLQDYLASGRLWLAIFAVWCVLAIFLGWRWWLCGILLASIVGLFLWNRPFTRRATLARFSRFLADLLEAGIATPDALRLAGYTVEQWRTRHAAWQLANDLEATGSFSTQAYCRPLSAAVVHALTPGTPASARLRLLRELSSCHAERLRVGLSWTSGILEPVAIALVGLIVGLTVIGLFLPLVRLVEGLSM